MRVDEAQQALQLVKSSERSEAIRARLQAGLLRKTLESQQEQSAELLKMMEGKGRIIDIRV